MKEETRSSPETVTIPTEDLKMAIHWFSEIPGLLTEIVDFVGRVDDTREGSFLVQGMLETLAHDFQERLDELPLDIKCKELVPLTSRGQKGGAE